MTEPMHYPDYPDICGSIRSMANAVSGLGVVTKPASQIRIEKRLWEIADALEKRYKEDRARGPVAQQAPAMAVGESRFACPFQTGCEDGEGFCEYPCEKWLDWHDAALIAQEREKWERERNALETKQAYRNGFDEGFEIGKAQCETHHQEIKEEAAAQAREDVLDSFAPIIAMHDINEVPYPDLYNEFLRVYKQLRPERTQQESEQ